MEVNLECRFVASGYTLPLLMVSPVGRAGSKLSHGQLHIGALLLSLTALEGSRAET